MTGIRSKFSAVDIIALAMAAFVCAFAPAYAEMPAGQDGVPLTRDQERGLKQGDTFRECTDCPEMVAVPAGSFTMGSPDSERGRDDTEGPQHVVMIPQPFAVGKFHVTRDQFAAFVREAGYAASSGCALMPRPSTPDGSWLNPGFKQEGSHPVVCLSWDDTKAYVSWLANKTGRLYRLPSEAEFEYAARGRRLPGSYPRFWFGDSESDLCKHANFFDQKAGVSSACNDGYVFTSPVGSYRPNAFGLYDMAGNAWQWMEDCWHVNYNSAPADGSAWTTACSGRGRVVRGGAWYLNPVVMRAASRSWFFRAYYGFRVARTLAPSDGSGR